MTFTVEFEREDDGRWLAEVRELPGVLAYGQTSDEAIAKAQALALRALADRIEILFGALAMQQWGIRLNPAEEEIDLTHYPDEFVAF